MKFTKKQIKQIIKEEIEKYMFEDYDWSKIGEKEPPRSLQPSAQIRSASSGAGRYAGKPPEDPRVKAHGPEEPIERTRVIKRWNMPGFEELPFDPEEHRRDVDAQAPTRDIEPVSAARLDDDMYTKGLKGDELKLWMAYVEEEKRKEEEEGSKIKKVSDRSQQNKPMWDKIRQIVQRK